MKKIIIHWTGGNYVPNEKELESYHFIVDNFGKIHAGKYTPLDNKNCYDGKYAKHTGGGNTNSIGIAIAGMFGYKNKDFVGNFPITRLQFEACMKKVAELTKTYGIVISRQTVLTHYEFGLLHPKTSSAGKPDIEFLPPFPKLKSSEIGNFIRQKVKWYRGKINFSP